MEGYYSVTEYAKLTGKDPGNIRRMLIYGRLLGEKFGNNWAIPKDAKFPEDNRIKSGEYRNWRQKYRLSSDNPVFFDTLKRMSMDLQKIYGNSLDKVILYGSYARGDQNEDSDADIAIILKEGNSERMHDLMIDAVVDYELECGITLSVLPIDEKEYKKWSKTLPFYKNIEKEGIVLWKAA